MIRIMLKESKDLVEADGWCNILGIKPEEGGENACRNHNKL